MNVGRLEGLYEEGMVGGKVRIKEGRKEGR
jgi:hypothetical protein